MASVSSGGAEIDDPFDRPGLEVIDSQADPVRSESAGNQEPVVVDLDA